MGAISQVNSNNREISQLQSNIVPPLNGLLANPITQGVILYSVPLTITVDNYINHGLGRPYVGFIITRLYAPGAVIFESATVNSLPGLQIILKTTATVTADLYVF